MSILKRGSTGEIVRRLQDTIDAPIDGTFGSATERALKTWQKANGFHADGEAGPDQQHEMGLSDAITLERGDAGELVKLLQDKLGIEQDGKFGKATADAVSAWQASNGLPATGAADPATLTRMAFFGDIGDEAPPPPAPPAPIRAAERAQVPATSTATSSATAPAATQAAQQISSWAYQLYDIKPDIIATLDVDLVVVDYSREGDDDTAFTPAEVTAMRTRAAGADKRIVSYMSIGEAESYRFYWRPEWSTPAGRPAWLDDENPDWPGNFKVRFWDPAWKAVIMGGKGAYLDRIIAAGFDGVYLDIIDAFEYWRDVKGEQADADRLMIDFVTEIAAYARARRPGFLIIPQNGEALLADAAYRQVISAQAKEDLYYGLKGDGRANRKADVDECRQCLVPAAEAGTPVIVVEYLDDAKKQADARARLAADGFAAYFAPRQLDDIQTSQFEV